MTIKDLTEVKQKIGTLSAFEISKIIQSLAVQGTSLVATHQKATEAISKYHIQARESDIEPKEKKRTLKQLGQTVKAAKKQMIVVSKLQDMF